MEEDQIIIDSYPWAVPTEEQKRMFDTLSHMEQLKMLQGAFIEGEKSGISKRSFDDIRETAKAKMKAKYAKR